MKYIFTEEELVEFYNLVIREETMKNTNFNEILSLFRLGHKK
jgi:hypothetical protein